jgi:hypothetical protein
VWRKEGRRERKGRGEKGRGVREMRGVDEWEIGEGVHGLRRGERWSDGVQRSEMDSDQHFVCGQ